MVMTGWMNPLRIAYCTLLAMQMNVARYRAPKDAKKPLRLPD